MNSSVLHDPLSGTKVRLWVKQKSTKVVLRLGSDLTSIRWMDGDHRGGKLDLHKQQLFVRDGVGKQHKAKRRLSLFRSAKEAMSVCIDTPSGWVALTCAPCSAEAFWAYARVLVCCVTDHQDPAAL